MLIQQNLFKRLVSLRNFTVKSEIIFLNMEVIIGQITSFMLIIYQFVSTIWSFQIVAEKFNFDWLDQIFYQINSEGSWKCLWNCMAFVIFWRIHILFYHNWWFLILILLIQICICKCCYMLKWSEKPLFCNGSFYALRMLLYCEWERWLHKYRWGIYSTNCNCWHLHAIFAS